MNSVFTEFLQWEKKSKMISKETSIWQLPLDAKVIRNGLARIVEGQQKKTNFPSNEKWILDW